MKNSIPLVCCFAAIYTSLIAQNEEYKSYPIHETGYSALFPLDPGMADVSLSNSELVVYTMEVSDIEKRYGLQLVMLEDNFVNSEKETLEELLMSYMQLLKLSYDVTSGIGYIKGQIHPENTKASGILDFWEDERGAQWAVKGWVDSHALVVMYVYTPTAEGMSVPYEFLDGFSFKKKEVTDNIFLPVNAKKNRKQ